MVIGLYFSVGQFENIARRLETEEVNFIYAGRFRITSTDGGKAAATENFTNIHENLLNKTTVNSRIFDKRKP